MDWGHSTRASFQEYFGELRSDHKAFDVRHDFAFLKTRSMVLRCGQLCGSKHSRFRIAGRVTYLVRNHEAFLFMAQDGAATHYTHYAGVKVIDY